VFICLPGLLVQRLTMRAETSPAEEIGLSFALGSGIFVPFALLSYFLESGLDTLMCVYVGFVVVLLAAWFLIARKRPFVRTQGPSWAYDGIFLIFMLIVICLFGNLAPVNAGLSSDYWYHLAQVRYLVDSSVIRNAFPFLHADIPQWMYPYNSYYLLLALASKATHTDVIRMWPAMRLVLTCVLFSCSLLFFRVLLHDRQKALLAALFFILPFLYLRMVSGIGGLTAIQNICYPKVGSLWIFLPAISACLVLFLRGETGFSGLVSAGIIALAFQNWHVVNVMFILIIFSAWFFGLAVTAQWQCLKRLVIFGICVSILPIVLFYFLNYTLIESVKTAFSFDSQYLSPDWYGATPILEDLPNGLHITKASYFFTFGNKAIQPWMVMAFFFLPLSVILSGKSRMARAYLAGFSLLPVFLAYNPFTVYVMVHYGAPFLVRRFLFILPVAQSFALVSLDLYQRCMEKLGQGVRKSLSYAVLLLLAAAVIGFPYLGPSENRAMLNPAPPRSLWELKGNMDAHVPIGATVLSDAATSQILSGLRWVRIVTSSKHFMVAMAPHHDERVNDLALFFSNRSTPVQRAAIAGKYRAGYVIARKRVADGIGIEGFTREYSGREYELWVKNGVGKPKACTF